MRPNLAFGPIDGLAQYLLYVSVVVLGVLLPLVLNAWRTRRDERRLAARTVAALEEEMRDNLRRFRGSQQGWSDMLAALGGRRVELEQRIERARRPAGGEVDGEAAAADAAEPIPAEPEVRLNLPLTQAIAWEVARLSDALRLLPPARLAAFTRAYRLQEVWERDRAILLEVALVAGGRSRPPRDADMATLLHRLDEVQRWIATVTYHVGLAEALVATSEAALEATAGPSPVAAAAAGAPA